MHRIGFLLIVGVVFSISTSIILATQTDKNFQTENGFIATISIDGHERTFYVSSSGNASTPQPLMIVLGQSGMSGQGTANLTQFHALEATQGFVIAYPQAIDFWNDGRTIAGFLPSGEPVDDVEYIDRIIDYLAGVYTIDLTRVYVVGYRDGGRMAYHLACQRSQRFAGAAVVGALMWEYIDRSCTSSAATPLSMLVIMSSQSQDYALGGGQYQSIFDSSRAYAYLSLNDTVNRWLARNQCNMETNQQFDAARINTNCLNGARVGSYIYAGGENTWLGTSRANYTGLDLGVMITQFLLGDPIWHNQSPAQTTEVLRTDVLYIPNSYDGSRAMPLVVMLHPTQLNGAEFAYISNMNSLAEQENFIVVYPEAIGRRWYYDRGYEFGAHSENYDDTLFITTLVDTLKTQINISKVYLVGMSSGGFMTQRIACETSNQFAAFSVVGSTAFPGLDAICADAPSVPLLMIHGTADADVPWQGLLAPEMSPYPYTTLPMQDTLSLWATHNDCNLNFEMERLPSASPETHIEHYQFDDCARDLQLYAVVGGGHAWIGIPNRLPTSFSGIVNTDLVAGDVIWDFLQTY